MTVIKFKRFDKPDGNGNMGPRIETYGEFHHWSMNCLRSIASMPDPDTPDIIWVTSLNDSLHSERSRHYTDEAMDIRSKNFPTRTSKLHFVARYSALLNSHPEDPHKFTVIFENEGGPEEHFHVQVRKGHTFMRF